MTENTMYAIVGTVGAICLCIGISIDNYLNTHLQIQQEHTKQLQLRIKCAQKPQCFSSFKSIDDVDHPS
jgi:hypothetical protein